MDFRLSEETKALLRTSKVKIMPKAKVNYYDSQEFYQRCPNLAPKNIYLYLDRVEKLGDVQKTLNKIAEETFSEKCLRWYKNIKVWFNKKKNV